jgi:LysM repeat protein
MAPMSTSVTATEGSPDRRDGEASTPRKFWRCRTNLGRWVGGVIVLVSTAWLADPVAADAASGTVVIVRPGDTLVAIAARTHTTVAALVAANHIANPNRITAKASLVIPVPGPAPGAPSATASSSGANENADIVPAVVARRGDTLTALAARYNTTVAALVAANHIAHPNFVAIGARLLLPVPPVPPGWGPGGPLPPVLLSHPDRMALRPAFVSAVAATGVPINLLEALCWWESGWQSSATSNTGAVGVCQLEPFTIGYAQSALLHNPTLNPRTAADNIAMAAAYLRDLITRTAGNTALALAWYFQGSSSVEHTGMAPATKTYVTGITNYAAIFAAAG